MTLPTQGTGPATVRVTLAEPVLVRTLVVAVLVALVPAKPMPATILAEMAVAGDWPPWLPPQRGTAYPTGERAGASLPVCDTLLVAAPAVAAGTAGTAGTLACSRYGVTGLGGEQAILVDALTTNPRGRRRHDPALPHGVLTLTAAEAGQLRWQVQVAGEPESAIAVAGRVGVPLDSRQAAALARLGAVTVRDAMADALPTAQAGVIAQLAMTGVVMHAIGLTTATEALVAPELIDLLRAPLPGADADPLEWELRSVAQRRAALRGHATEFALPAAAGVHPSSALPSVSALLVTRRPHHVAGAVAALVAQSYSRLEVVIGLHGFDLPVAERDELAACGIPVQILVLPAELSFGEALAAVTRAARGSLVTKVDDDDGYGPEHVWDLVLARHYASATVVGKAAEFVYLAPYDTTVRRRMGSERYTDVVAGGAMLLARGDLEEVGGWRPVRRSVDRGLLDRVLHAGGLIYRTHSFGFVYTRHTDGHTWDPGLPYFVRNPLRQWPGLPPYPEFAVRSGGRLGTQGGMLAVQGGAG